MFVMLKILKLYIFLINLQLVVNHNSRMANEDAFLLFDTLGLNAGSLDTIHIVTVTIVVITSYSNSVESEVSVAIVACNNSIITNTCRI
jgi:hypothetical protein